MQVGVLAVQGAFAEHEHVLSELGVSCLELRNAGDLNKPYDALILPGGESTVQGKLLRDSDMFDTIKSQIEGGMPFLPHVQDLFFWHSTSKVMTLYTLALSLSQ